MKASMLRLRIIIHGAVQGVGFRPYVYRLAASLGLTGWIINNSGGVYIEVEGERGTLEQFLLRLPREAPPLAFIASLEFSFLDAVGFDGFEIRHSDDSEEKTAFILPDIATCDECLREVFSAANRRFEYPFTNCTNCGPRYSIIEALPYDRCHTSMKQFQMCEACQAEYDAPRNRRFHAQPNACPVCGPHVELWDAEGKPIARFHDAILGAADAIRQGRILALKGLGGFQLIVEASNAEAVARLRKRKHREEKPFALMFPTLDMTRQYCHVSELAARSLTSPQRPILLLERRRDIAPNELRPIADNVAPNNPYLGVMLPCTPLHHLLMRAFHFPIVATSGNLTDEPMAIDNDEALDRLGGIADVFLIHNRPIVRPVDDSVVRIVLGKEQVIRRARGFAPLPIMISLPPLQARGRRARRILAVGAHLKNTIAIGVGNQVFISQHIGDLETGEAYAAMQRTIKDLAALYGFEPEAVACDMHPNYLSTQYAKSLGLPVVEVQHHHAHVAACMAENDLSGEVLGIVWDGAGYGVDGTIWGGEFLLVREGSFKRVAHFMPFKLPSGDKAVKQPRRTALGVLYELFGDAAANQPRLLSQFTENEQRILITMLQKGVNAPVTTSAGRLFDAVASLTGLRQQGNFEGQAAMELEFALHPGITDAYPFDIRDGEPMVVDWRPTIHAVLADAANLAIGVISAKFHNTLVEMMVKAARRVGVERICLTGGVFQNRRLTERGYARLAEEGFQVYIHQRTPPNDGGVSLGQVVVAASITD
jgi:hydrogenase maturation protein HypF